MFTNVCNFIVALIALFFKSVMLDSEGDELRSEGFFLMCSFHTCGLSETLFLDGNRTLREYQYSLNKNENVRKTIMTPPDYQELILVIAKFS